MVNVPKERSFPRGGAKDRPNKEGLKRKKQICHSNDFGHSKKMKKQHAESLQFKIEDTGTGNEVLAHKRPNKSKRSTSNETSLGLDVPKKSRHKNMNAEPIGPEVSESEITLGYRLKKSRNSRYMASAFDVLDMTEVSSETIVCRASNSLKEDPCCNETNCDTSVKKKKMKKMKRKSDSLFETRDAKSNPDIKLNSSSEIISSNSSKKALKIKANYHKFKLDSDTNGCRPIINDTCVDSITNVAKKKKRKKKKSGEETDQRKQLTSKVMDTNSGAPTKPVKLPLLLNSSSEIKSSNNTKKSKTNITPLKTKANADKFKSKFDNNKWTMNYTNVASITNSTKKKKNKNKGGQEIDQVAQLTSNRMKKSTRTKETVSQVVDTDSDSDDNDPTKPITLPSLSATTGFVWDATPSLLPAVVGPGGAEEESSDEETVETKKVKRSRQAIIAEKRLQAQIEEARLRSIEQRLMDPEQLPQTADEFDRLVLSSPDNSMVWLQYMAYHIQATEIEKARSIAQRALKTISFREEREKLNVWMAWLNLENLYGTRESMQNTLEEAIRLNDPYQVYTQTLQIYADSHKLQDGDELITVMTRKFKTIKDMWITVATFYMKSGQTVKARALLQRALASLEKKEHVSVITQFALLENRLGSRERAQTLMEQILTSYPKRVDVWSVYVDMLVKCELFDMARQVLERAVAQRLPSHKMKTLFKKFLAFEEAHGTEEGANRVRQLALDYVEAAAGNTME